MDKENRQANADSTGVCKKLYDAVAAHPAFRAIHRKSGQSQSPMAVITDQNQPGVQRTVNAAKPNVLDTLKQPVAQHEAGTGSEVHNIPIELGPSTVPKEQVKTVKPPPSVQRSSGGLRGTISPAKIETSGHFAPKEHTSVPVSHGQWSKVATEKEAKPTVSSLTEEKLKQEKAASASTIVIQSLGQGTSAPPRVEPARPSRTSSLEEQKKPKAHAVTKAMPTKIDLQNLPHKGDQDGKKPEHSSVSNKFSDYITLVKNKMRTPSNVREETVNPSPSKRLATRRDSFNDKVVNYINRARKSIRTTSNVRDA